MHHIDRMKKNHDRSQKAQKRFDIKKIQYPFMIKACKQTKNRQGHAKETHNSITFNVLKH